MKSWRDTEGLFPASPMRRYLFWTESSLSAIIAATALVNRLALIHNNAGDFEAIRSAIERAPERFPGLGPLELIPCGSLAAT
jgi:hypothetical protein